MSGLIAWTKIYTNGRALDSMEGYPESPELLEIGVFITNADHPFEFRGAVNHVLTNYLTGDEARESMTYEAFEEHEQTGLNDILRSVTAFASPEKVEEDIIEMLERKGTKDDYVLACESWVPDWIDTWFPSMFEWFCDSRLDISTVRRVFDLCQVEVDEVEQEFSPRCAQQAHRDFEEFLRYSNFLFES